jgi:CRISPR system Cascade subunit CasA
VDGHGNTVAWTVSTKKERIDAKALNGRTGDPWVPLIADGPARKALTLDAEGFSYRRLVPLLFPRPTDSGAPTQSLLQRITDSDAEVGLAIMARGVVRGQGKTEGYHERRIPVSRRLRRSLGPAMATDAVAKIAEERVENAGVFARKVLFPTAMTIFTGAPGSRERARDDEVSKARARTVSAAFERAVDARFFVDLSVELEVLEDSDARRAVRGEWLLALRDIGRHLVDEALAAAPDAAMRHYRIAARAHRRFESAFHSQFGEWMPYQPQTSVASVATTDTPEPEGTLAPDHVD